MRVVLLCLVVGTRGLQLRRGCEGPSARVDVELQSGRLCCVSCEIGVATGLVGF